MEADRIPTWDWLESVSIETWVADRIFELIKNHSYNAVGRGHVHAKDTKDLLVLLFQERGQDAIRDLYQVVKPRLCDQYGPLFGETLARALECRIAEVVKPDPVRAMKADLMLPTEEYAKAYHLKHGTWPSV
jgi:hypothetical protein